MAIEMQPPSVQLSIDEPIRQKVLSTLEQMRVWPYWEEIYLNVVKETHMSYASFVHAVQAGAISTEAFTQAVMNSTMTREDFLRYLEEYLKFMALSVHCDGIGMTSSYVDEIWHAHLLVTDRYRQFCETFFGFYMDHFPCSQYELYGIDVRENTSQCKCCKSCCGVKLSTMNRDEIDPEVIRIGILNATPTFIQAYTAVYGQKPDRAIWDHVGE